MNIYSWSSGSCFFVIISYCCPAVFVFHFILLSCIFVFFFILLSCHVATVYGESQVAWDNLLEMVKKHVPGFDSADKGVLVDYHKAQHASYEKHLPDLKL